MNSNDPNKPIAINNLEIKINKLFNEGWTTHGLGCNGGGNNNIIPREGIDCYDMLAQAYSRPLFKLESEWDAVVEDNKNVWVPMYSFKNLINNTRLK
jgi:hypothetical protein